MRTGPNCGSDRQRVVRRAGCSCALSATDRRADRRRDALAPGKECLQPVEHESGLLFDDPVSGVVNCLDLEVTHAIGIAAQQRLAVITWCLAPRHLRRNFKKAL